MTSYRDYLRPPKPNGPVDDSPHPWQRADMVVDGTEVAVMFRTPDTILLRKPDMAFLTDQQLCNLFDKIAHALGGPIDV